MFYVFLAAFMTMKRQKLQSAALREIILKQKLSKVQKTVCYLSKASTSPDC
jgi:hypothetical protein